MKEYTEEELDRLYPKVGRNMEETFSNRYKRGGWKGGGSGEGSTEEITRPYREFIEEFIRKHKIKSIVDLGCGDWRFSCLIDWQDANYLGLDIVPEVVRANQEKFGQKNIHFKVSNIDEEELPEAELIIIKDVIQHWSTEKVLAFLKRLKPYKHALITNCYTGNVEQNSDVPTGRFRPLDITKPPFSVPAEDVLTFGTKKVFLMRGAER